MSEVSELTGREETSVAEVDRIRDIIFGPQMRTYEQQFKRVAAHLDQLGRQLEELRAALEQQRIDQESLTREAQQELNKRHDTLEASHAQQTAQMQAEFRQSLDQQAADSKAQVAQLAADMRKLGQDLRSELTAAADELENDKASRQHVGDLLVEMGTRLKEQKGLADLLGQLAEQPPRKR